MNFGSERKRSPLVNVTPLIDALFLLLIFFMVSSTFRDLPGIPLDLPRTKTGEANRSSGVEIQIDREGVYRLQGRIVGEADLETRLGEALGQADSRDLLLRADRGVPYGRVVTVMDLARELKVNRLVVATENVLPEETKR
jgi:biopolymer transport protein ExbD